MEFQKKRNSPAVAVFDIRDYEKAKRFGNVKLDENHRIIEFTEKPPEPKSTLISTACYIFPRNTLPLFSKYISENNNKDSPGFFLQWLHKRLPVYGFVFNGHWFDIGDMDSLEKARQFMEK